MSSEQDGSGSFPRIRLIPVLDPRLDPGGRLQAWTRAHLGTVSAGGVFVVVRLRVVVEELQLRRAHHAAPRPVARRAGSSRAGGTRVGGAAGKQTRRLKERGRSQEILLDHLGGIRGSAQVRVKPKLILTGSSADLRRRARPRRPTGNQEATGGTSCSTGGVQPDVPDGPGGRGQRAHEMGDVVWNVDGQRGDLRLHRLHRRLRSFSLHLLAAGQSREGDLDVGAGEPEGAPAGGDQG